MEAYTMFDCYFWDAVARCRVGTISIIDITNTPRAAPCSWSRRRWGICYPLCPCPTIDVINLKISNCIIIEILLGDVDYRIETYINQEPVLPLSSLMAQELNIHYAAELLLRFVFQNCNRKINKFQLTCIHFISHRRILLFDWNIFWCQET